MISLFSAIFMTAITGAISFFVPIPEFEINFPFVNLTLVGWWGCILSTAVCIGLVLGLFLFLAPYLKNKLKESSGKELGIKLGFGARSRARIASRSRDYRQIRRKADA